MDHPVIKALQERVEKKGYTVEEEHVFDGHPYQPSALYWEVRATKKNQTIKARAAYLTDAYERLLGKIAAATEEAKVAKLISSK